MTTLNPKQYAKKLIKEKIYYSNIPEEIKYNLLFLREMRKAGLYKIKNKGYDIINDAFFINETQLNFEENGPIEENVERTFESFKDYLIFLDGESLYENACYYQCSLERLSLNELSKGEQECIFIDKLLKDCYYVPFINQTVELYFSDYIRSLQVINEEIKNKKRHLVKWLEKFLNAMYSVNEFTKVYKQFEKSSFNDSTTTQFIFNNLFAMDKSKKFLPVYYECINNGVFEGYKTRERVLGFIYSPEEIIENFKYNKTYTLSTQNHKKRKMKIFLSEMQGKQITILKKYYNQEIGFYCVEYGSVDFFTFDNLILYFDKFEDFAAHLQNDLSDADLHYAPIRINKNDYIINQNTKIVTSASNLKLSLNKYYSNGRFVVEHTILNEEDVIIEQHQKSFKYLFDYIYYLNKDLSNCDLIYCDGFKNVRNITDINLTNVKLLSPVAEKLKLSFKCTKHNLKNLSKSDLLLKNEQTSLSVLNENRDLYTSDEANDLLLAQSLDKSARKIYYISDIHLLHKLQHYFCRSDEDILYHLPNFIIGAKEYNTPIIIAGDICSDYELFKEYIKLVRQRNRHNDIFVTLGNHELWSFKGQLLENIVKEYKTFLSEYNIKLLHNNAFFYDKNGKIQEITTEDILHNSIEHLLRTTHFSKMILFGGIGFAGANLSFNANNGIYLDVITREDEILESAKFYSLYKKILPILNEHNGIVVTHMPKEDWSGNSDFNNNIVYISGHNHKNFFYDDNETRIYSDNQIGYSNNNVVLKYLFVSAEYDCFKEYQDGIYEISKEEYINFYRGKNITIDFYRNVNILYMLKCDGYYCFIHKNKKGDLSILNGGSLSKLYYKNINYYFNNMRLMIEIINNPLSSYSKLQKQLAHQIQKLGGSGKIHGCIIDINFYNHIFVNPNDCSLHGYFALDIYNKIVYPSIPTLLEKQCPEMHEKYMALLESGRNNLLATTNDFKKPEAYFSTDIYYVSRIIKKMQRLESHILTYWNDQALNSDKDALESTSSADV